MLKSPLAGVVVDRNDSIVISKFDPPRSILGAVYYVHNVSQWEGTIPVATAFHSRHATLTAARIAAGLVRNVRKAA